MCYKYINDTDINFTLHRIGAATGPNCMLTRAHDLHDEAAARDGLQGVHADACAGLVTAGPMYTAPNPVMSQHIMEGCKAIGASFPLPLHRDSQGRCTANLTLKIVAPWASALVIERGGYFGLGL